MSAWSGLDFVIFLIFLLNVLLGMARGGFREIISLISLCAALVITIKFTIPVTKFVNSSPLITDVVTSQFSQNFMQAIGMPPLTESMLLQMGYCISLLICFVGSFSICEAALSYSSVMEAFGFSTAMVNRKLGAAMGSTRGFVIVLIFMIVLEHLFSGNLPESYFISLLGGAGQKLDYLIMAQAPERYLEVLKSSYLYNQTNVMKDLLQPK